MISFKEILAYMKTGDVFTCEVVTFNQQKKSGGKVKSFRAVLLTRLPVTSLRGLTPKEKEESNLVEKDPNHKAHYTRNIQLITEDGFATEIIRKIHIPLIVRFNGQKVCP